MSTTICCLIYGDYPKLADRCLRPISELYKHGVEVRIGCNDMSKATEDVINQLFSPSDNLTVIKNSPQIYKYPMMRKLFNCKPIVTDKVMWFDDDSYIKDPNPVAWLKSVESLMIDKKADMIGSLYHIPVSPKQKEWRRLHCSWFKVGMHTGKTLFATGGWWAISTNVLVQYDWPHPLLKHRGGDVLLGELMRHASLNLVKFNNGVAINADNDGKESASKRRGYDEPPIGS
jgi:hypothetical protein